MSLVVWHGLRANGRGIWREKSVVTDDTSRSRLSGAHVAAALVRDAGVTAGLGTVPLGRCHRPDRRPQSDGCGRRQGRIGINLSLHVRKMSQLLAQRARALVRFCAKTE
mgnify:CR=1 FL=1